MTIACVYCGGSHERAVEVRACFERRTARDAEPPNPAHVSAAPPTVFECPSCGRTHASKGAVSRCAKLKKESELAQRQAHRRVEEARARAARRSFGDKWDATSGGSRRLRDGNGETQRPADIELHRRISRGKERYE